MEDVSEIIGPEERERRIGELGPIKARIYSNPEDYEILSSFLKRLEDKYGYDACGNNMLWHFIGSSGGHLESETALMIWDFPGGDSIEAYLRKVGNELKDV